MVFSIFYPVYYSFFLLIDTLRLDSPHFPTFSRLKNEKSRSVNCAPTASHKGKPERRDDFSEKISQLREAAQRDRNLDDKHNDPHSYFKQTWDYFN